MPRLTRAQRIEAGITWLNAQKPGWINLIDLTKLDIEQGTRCICGQVFEEEASSSNGEYRSGFNYARQHLDLLWAADEFGFDVGREGEENIANLERAWKRRIKQLRSEAQQ